MCGTIKTFKDNIIGLVWKKTELIPFDPMLMVDKVCNRPTSTWNTTLFPTDWIPLDKTSTSVKEICKSMFNQLTSAFMPKQFYQTWAKFAKGVCQIAQNAELLDTKLNNTNTVKNAWKTQQQQTTKVFNTNGILYAKNAHRMVWD